MREVDHQAQAGNERTDFRGFERRREVGVDGVHGGGDIIIGWGEREGL